MARDALTGLGIGVSGGGTHLGRATALALAAAGAEVVVLGRRGELLEETCALASDLPGRIHAEIADPHGDADLERVLDRLEKEAGRVYGWVNNACGAAPSLLGRLNRAKVAGALTSGLEDVMLATEAAAERRAERS